MGAQRARPAHIQQAIFDDNTALLSAAGRKGGKKKGRRPNKGNKKPKKASQPLAWTNRVAKPSPEAFQAQLARQFGD